MNRNLIWLLPIALVVGCGGGGPDLGPTGTVTGKVTSDGKPVTGGSVWFHTAGQIGFGEIGPDGVYSMSWNTGGQHGEQVPIGEYRIAIHPPEVGGGSTQDHPNFPKKYADPSTSGLNRTVAEGENTFDLEMTP